MADATVHAAQATRDIIAWTGRQIPTTYPAQRAMVVGGICFAIIALLLRGYHRRSRSGWGGAYRSRGIAERFFQWIPWKYQSPARWANGLLAQDAADKAQEIVEGLDAAIVEDQVPSPPPRDTEQARPQARDSLASHSRNRLQGPPNTTAPRSMVLPPITAKRRFLLSPKLAARIEETFGEGKENQEVAGAVESDRILPERGVNRRRSKNRARTSSG